MSIQFDSKAENDKLMLLREREEEDLADLLSGKYGAQYTDLTSLSIDVDALRMIPEARAREGELALFSREAKKVSVAFKNPQNEILKEVLDELIAKQYLPVRFLVSRKSLESAWEHYQDVHETSASAIGKFGMGEELLAETLASYTSLGVLKTRLVELLQKKNQNTVSHIIEQVFACAYALGASDIHIEPEENSTRLRLRLDGFLQDAYTFDTHLYQMISSRLKLLSGLKLNVSSKAQDGRFTIVFGKDEIEVRASVIPGAYGESFVLRLLDPRTIHRTYEEMGMHPKLLERLRREIHKPNGLLLVTGPTGSGKTTTLYTFMQDLYSPDIKIITIEDPIEYHLDGIVQTQTKAPDYTFASGLRSVLRQDPDVIMVGEIRDKEVADTAIQASLTGHFVFSTLHTNNAAGSFPRLVDLEVEPKLFASSVTAAMAQRLVRTLDDTTKKARLATPEEKAMMEKVFSTLTDKTLLPASYDTLYEAVPSADGLHTGYKGRIGIHEAIFMDEELGTFLRDNPSESDIQRHSVRQGYLTMAQDAISKALAGKTTLEEIRRVVDLPQ